MPCLILFIQDIVRFPFITVPYFPGVYSLMKQKNHRMKTKNSAGLLYREDTEAG
jgi:hypothetical protein